MPLTVERFDHIVLNCRNVEATARWYERVLGMQVERGGPAQRVALVFGNQKINLRPLGARDDDPDWTTGLVEAAGSEDLCFITASTPDQVREHLNGCGVEVINGPVTKIGALGPMVSHYCRDLDGNLVEIAVYPSAPGPGGSASPTRLGVSDAGEVLTLQRAAFVTEAQLHADMALPPLMQTLDELREELTRPSVFAWGYRVGGRLVASTRIEVTAHVAELRRTSVAPDQQGQGWGTKLLTEVEHLLASSVTAIELFTGEHSAANLRLYQRLGYTETSRTLAGAYSLVHMRKVLRVEAGPSAEVGR